MIRWKASSLYFVAIASATALHRALLVDRRDHRPADLVGELPIPLGVEAGAAGLEAAGHPRVVAQVLGDQEPAGEPPADLGVDLLEQGESLGDRLVAREVGRADEHGAVDPQAVDPVFVQPQQRVVDEEPADLPAGVVGAAVTPGRLGPPVVEEVDAPQVVLGPAVEPPQVHVLGAEVVVYDVEDHGNPPAVAFLDERLQGPGAAVGRLDGEDVRRGIAPGPGAGELGDRHDLDGVDPQLPQVLELLGGRLEGAGPAVLPPLVVERADVQLVDDQLVAGRHAEFAGPPVEGRVVDHAVARRVGDLAGVGVDPRERRRPGSPAGSGTRARAGPRRPRRTSSRPPRAPSGPCRRPSR